MTRLGLMFVLVMPLAGCLALPSREPEPPDNAGYCASLGLLLDSVDPRMAAQARSDMQAARCPVSG
jgi:hypothetical protein